MWQQHNSYLRNLQKKCNYTANGGNINVSSITNITNIVALQNKKVITNINAQCPACRIAIHVNMEQVSRRLTGISNLAPDWLAAQPPVK